MKKTEIKINFFCLKSDNIKNYISFCVSIMQKIFYYYPFFWS